MNRYIKVTLIAVALLCSPLSFAAASGIAVEPSRLVLEGVAGRELTATLVVENPGPRVALLEVYPDDFSDSIRLRPASFTLESGERREIQVTAVPRRDGVLTTMLSIVSRPLSDSEREFNAALGAKISLTVRGESDTGDASAVISAAIGRHWPTAALGLFSVLLVIYLAHRYVKRNG